MKKRINFALASGFVLSYSSSALAHPGDAGVLVPHILTGEHLIVAALTAVVVAVFLKRQRRQKG